MYILVTEYTEDNNAPEVLVKTTETEIKEYLKSISDECGVNRRLFVGEELSISIKKETTIELSPMPTQAKSVRSMKAARRLENARKEKTNG